MAVDAPLIMRQTVLAAKIETTTGTAISLTTADATTNIFDATMAYDIGPQDRRGQGTSSRIPQIPGVRRGTCSFMHELYNSGSSGTPSWAKFMQACGVTFAAGVFTPTTGGTSPTTLTMGQYTDGLLEQIAGAVGNCKLAFRAGETVKASYDFTGKHVTPTDTAILAPTYDTQKPPRWAGATCTIGGTDYKISQMDIDFGNVIAPRYDESDATGVHAFCVSDRDITVSMLVEATLLATKDWFGDHLASTEVALSNAWGSGTNNVLTLACPKLQLRSVPRKEDSEGVVMWRLEFQANRSAAAGDDELTLTLS